MRTLLLCVFIIFLGSCQPLELRGEIKDHEGKPINGALIMTKRSGQPIAEIRADKNGYFALTQMHLDDTVTVIAPGFRTETTIYNFALARYPKLTFWLKHKN